MSVNINLVGFAQSIFEWFLNQFLKQQQFAQQTSQDQLRKGHLPF